jgi:maleate isomerase
VTHPHTQSIISEDSKCYRIGQIVPSSNTTMETEIPAIFRSREAVFPERFTFHSARMRMKHVTAEELAAMDAQSDRCASELGDARVDVMGYACLVAIMSKGLGYHTVAEARLGVCARDAGAAAQVVSSAGALIEAIRALGARKISLIAPYLKPLTQRVVEYIEGEGIEVHDAISLEISDNLAVGRRNPMQLLETLTQLSTGPADLVVLSACVQMPSLAAIPNAESIAGRPVVSASSATAFRMMQCLSIAPCAPNCGALLKSTAVVSA